MSVPVTKGTYAANETQVYSYLISTMGLNKAAACGVLANIRAESSFNHLASGDNGTSFGLCQWHKERWNNLTKFCNQRGLNPKTVKGQMAFLHHELTTGYSSTVWKELTSANETSQGAYDTAYSFCKDFERPANAVQKSQERGTSARNTFWAAYSGTDAKTVTTPVEDKGHKIVEEALSHLGKSYLWGTEGPNTFDCSGFTYYCYKQAINYNWSRTTAFMQWKKYGREVKDFKAGDLIFFKDTYDTGNNPNISHVGIATGKGKEFVQATGSGGVHISNLDTNSYWNSKYHSTKRLLSDEETSYEEGSNNVTVEESTSATELDYDAAIADIESRNAASLLAGSRMYGFVRDITNGGEFKFIVPEYGVQISPSWEDVSILGRSVNVRGYNSTPSRTIEVRIEVMAGAGLYEKSRTPGGDPVDDLHKDIAFLQSLAYPDYRKAIIMPPANVALYLGPLHHMRGTLDDVTVDYRKPYTTDLRPMRAEISFRVTHTTEYPPDYQDIRRGDGDIRGTKTGTLVVKGSTSVNSTSSR